MATTTALAAALCHRTGVSRWTSPVDQFNAMGEWTPDPGPYTVGKTVECDCGAPVTVTKTVTNERSAGTQYVAHTEPHQVPGAAAREALRTTVRETLAALVSGRVSADEAEESIMATLATR
ncbi:hypothetical protein [Streptomyces sp. NPDC018055]|uniref:hypothetical protein n=1 Tax=Streptomyces sp. NPDC018055 TaxID=3365038 RepID=UPI00378B4E76